MNEEELRRNDLTISEVARKVRRASLNLTFGELRTGAGGVVLNVIGKRKRGEEFGDIPLITRLDGSVLRLGDVARIRDGFVDEEVLSEVDGRPAILVRVEAGEEHSVFGISTAIEDWLRTYEPPAGVEVEVWSNSVDGILDRFSGILLNAVVGMILVFVCLVLVFDLRVATWIAVGIPISFIGSLLFFDVSDLTLNMGTLFAFFLLIGIVVDDAVVVGESIAAEREKGKSALDAAVSGARAVAGPITVGVLTTVLAFVPLLFVTTGNYQMVKVFPLVAFFVLLVSLVEAFCILPSHLSHAGRWSLSPLSDIQTVVRDWLDGLRDAVVVPAVSWSVRHIYLTFLLGLVFVVAALWLLRAEIVRVVVLDSAANVGNTIQADLELPAGAPFEASVAAGQRFVRAARAIDDRLEGSSIESVSLIVGNLAGGTGSQTGQDEANRSHLASVRLHLHERPLRQASPEVIERRWREAVGDVSELEKLSIQTTRIRFRPGVAYALLHDDPETLRDAGRELGAYLRTVPGLYAQSDSLSSGKRHFEIRLTPVGEAAGLTPAMIGKQLRANFHGLEVQRIQRGRDEISVVVRYPAERRRSLRELASERIVRPGGQEIPLSAVARIVERRELATLTSYRREAGGPGQRACRLQQDHRDPGQAGGRRELPSRSAREISRPFGRAGRRRPGRTGAARDPRRAGPDRADPDVRVDGRLPAQLLEAAGGRYRRSDSLCRSDFRPLGAGLGPDRDIAVRHDRGGRRHRERRAGAARPLQHDPPRERGGPGDRRRFGGHERPFPRRVPDLADHRAGAVSAALRAERRTSVPGAVRRQHVGGACRRGSLHPVRAAGAGDVRRGPPRSLIPEIAADTDDT